MSSLRSALPLRTGADPLSWCPGFLQQACSGLGHPPHPLTIVDGPIPLGKDAINCRSQLFFGSPQPNCEPSVSRDPSLCLGIEWSCTLSLRTLVMRQYLAMMRMCHVMLETCELVFSLARHIHFTVVHSLS